MSQKANTTQDTSNNELKVVVVEGTITEARFGKTRFNDTEKYRIGIRSEAIPYDEIKAFEKSGSKLTPKWFKDRTGYLNLASVYTIPVKDSKGREIDFTEWLNNYNVLGSQVKVSIIQKEGAVYPKAIKVIADGEARDAFEDL